MAATPAPPAGTSATPQEEPRYPDREFTLPRMNAKERNSGAIGFRFTHEFRQSCFHFTFGLSQQREQILLPPRSQLVRHINDFSPNYQFPSCLSNNKDINTEVKVKKSTADEFSDVIKIDYKKPTVTADDDAEEDQQERGSSGDEDNQSAEEDNEEDLIGDYNINQFEDHETGEDIGSDDGSDDN
ncbi:hypothetical protein TRFO_28241 [Tritrichomonas foetus]|uniref:Uncharacterized protein n=1 Tax=Tritrichomonas foetus TaxID=1144522 RepID=A0A1J4K3F9_9EUKA|nr:hypothetical protein TRFO_28241 [Tritrichomonas foetus]|eukprot:OHT04262.1 hypothetical protein TRFO_28241 [Tritrichomonas foetus]